MESISPKDNHINILTYGFATTENINWGQHN